MPLQAQVRALLPWDELHANARETACPLLYDLILRYRLIGLNLVVEMGNGSPSAIDSWKRVVSGPTRDSTRDGTTMAEA